MIRSGYREAFSSGGSNLFGLKMSLSNLKWIATVAPVGFLALLVFLLRGPADEDLHQFPYLVVVAVVSIITCGFSFFVFGIIERLERRVLQQNRHLSVLNEIATAATESLELDEFLRVALGKVFDVTGAEAGVIWLVEEGTRDVSVACYRGFSAEQAPARRLAPSQEPNTARELRTDRPFLIEHLLEDPLALEFARRDGFRSAISLPLKAEGEVYGALGVFKRRAHSFAPAEAEFLASIAGQLGMATRSARLRERVLDRAVLEERERLGRELHDGLGQMVGYVIAQSLAIKKLLASGRRDEAERQAGEMERAAKSVSTDVREAILGLRTSGHGLLPSLRMYLADFGRIAETGVRLEADADVETLGLRLSTEIQLERIVQEALSNVRKHAHARSAIVRLTSDEDELTVEVTDDGRGFDRADLSSAALPRFGLETMRERAEGIGGSFEIVSGDHGGTTVTVKVPLGRKEVPADARAAG